MKPQVNYIVRIEPKTNPIEGNALTWDPVTDREMKKWSYGNVLVQEGGER